MVMVTVCPLEYFLVLICPVFHSRCVLCRDSFGGKLSTWAEMLLADRGSAVCSFSVDSAVVDFAGDVEVFDFLRDRNVCIGFLPSI